MRRLHSLLPDGFEEASTASRRSVIVGSLKLAGGGALALAFAGNPRSARLAAAQDDTYEEGQADDGQGGQGDGGGGRGGDGQGGGGRGGDGQGGGGRGGQDAGQVAGVPSVGVGITGGSDGQTASLIGLAAAGAAAAAVLVRYREPVEQATDV
jgi:hypothetical protein